MIDILRQINEGDTMKDMIENIIKNINFYMKHRSELADIHLSDEYLSNYLDMLHKTLDRYIMDEENIKRIPQWFKTKNPYHFTSGNFPYTTPLFDWEFSFKEWIEILLSEKGDIITSHQINVNGAILTADEWRRIKNDLLS